MTNIDEKYYNLLKSDSEEGMKVIFNYYYSPLCVYASKFITVNEDVEDIVNGVFISLWEKRDKIDINTSLGAFLYTSVKNSSLNYLKHLKVRAEFQDSHKRNIEQAQDYYRLSQETGQSVLVAKELRQKIESAMDSLPEKCREIFTLSRDEGLKNKEIAKKLGVTVNTVQKQMSIALAKLRYFLKEELVELYLIIIYLFLT